MRAVHLEPIRFAQGPLHFQNDHSFDGFAVSPTVARAGKRRRHFDRQAIPRGLLVTFPSPLTATVKRTPRGDVEPDDALGMATARTRRRETTASRLVAVELDKPGKFTRRILCLRTRGVNARSDATVARPVDFVRKER